MAEFTPNIPTTGIPSFGGDARPASAIRSDRSLGTLFEGVGEAAAMGAGVVDNAVQQNIREDIQEGTELIQREFGVEDASILESDIDAAPLPSDLGRASENLKTLRTAVDQGRLSQVHYTARLDSMVRQMRSRYPGYRDQIDKIVQDVTGITPANTLQRQLMQEFESSRASQTSASEKFVSYMQTNEKYLPSNGWQRYNNGELNQLQIRSYIENAKKQEAAQEARRATMSEAQARAELNSSDAFRNARVEVNTIMDRAFKDATSYGGQNFLEFQKRLDQARRSDNRITPEEETTLRQQFNQLKSNILFRVEETLSQPWSEDSADSYYTVLDQDRIEDLRAQAAARLTFIEDALVDQNFGVLAQQAAMITAVEENAELELLSDPNIAAISALNSVAGPDFVSGYLNRNEKQLKAVDFAMRNFALSRQGGSGEPITDVIKDIQSKGITDSRTYTDFVNKNIDALSSPEIGEQGWLNYVQSVYGAESYNLFGEFERSERLELYNKLTAPAITAKFEQMRGSNPEAAALYQVWAVDRFGALFKEEADSIRGAAVDDRAMNLQFNPETSQFSATPITERITANTGLVPDFGAVGRSLSYSTAQSAIQKINTALRNIKPIVEMNGGNLNEELARMLIGMGLDKPITPEQGGGFFERLGGAITDNLRKTGFPLLQDGGNEENRGESEQVSEVTQPNILLSTLAELENASGAGLRNGRYFPHASPEGGTDTIGFGHKLTQQEIDSKTITLSDGTALDYSNGLAPDEAQRLMEDDFQQAASQVEQEWNKHHGSDVRFSNLPSKYQDTLASLAFNVGSLARGNSWDWPKLARAMKEGDEETIRQEMMTSFVDPSSGERLPLRTRRDRLADALGLPR